MKPINVVANKTNNMTNHKGKKKDSYECYPNRIVYQYLNIYSKEGK